MKKFIIKTLSISCILLGVVFILLITFSTLMKSKGFTNYSTESNTLFLTNDTQYDILFMGISHARNFSRQKTHLRIEKSLNSRIINIGQGYGACGINEQLFYLDYFYYKGNNTSKIIYVLSPPMLFSSTLPIASNTFENEAFEIPFLWRYYSFESENKNARIMSYIQGNLSPNWFIKQPYSDESKDEKLDSLDRAAVIKGQNIAYSGTGLNFKQFNKSKIILEKTIKLANRNKSEVILLIPPALFGKWRGHQQTIDLANKMKNKYKNIEVFDASETMMKPEFYYDNHHLNTNGVVFFTENYLKPLIK